MGTEFFLHPDHVVPGALLVAGGVEMGNSLVAEALMKGNAGGIGVSDAGAQIADILLCQALFQFLIKRCAYALVVQPHFHINGSLRRPAVSSSGMKGGGVCIAQDLTVLLCDQIGIAG